MKVERVAIEEPIKNEEVVEDSSPTFGSFQPLTVGAESPVHFIAFFDTNVNEQKVILYPWQVEIGEKFGSVKPTGLSPFKFCLCAANGSGKDAFVIAPFCLWFICCKVRSLVIVTSSSGIQLTNQTEKYIVALAEKVNNWAIGILGAPIIKIRKRRITCLLSGSEIMLFATDEGAKAEGYHPVEPGAEMAIVVNEAKSVSPEIFSALKRCTGYNYWINVSSPGEPIGEFYNSYEKWPNVRTVSYYDCMRHQSREEFENDRKELGEHDALFRSKWLAKFTFIGGKNVVNQMALERLKRRIAAGEVKHINKGEIRIGIDVALSSHGDESVITRFDGNKQTHMLVFRIKDATKLADRIEYALANEFKLTKDFNRIFIDDGNVGRAVADILQRKGWSNLRRVLNQSPAKNKKQYRNRGAELWNKFAKLIEHNCLILLEDDRLYKQIASRKYKESDTSIDKLVLQSKMSMKNEGLPSPDRADTCVLAFADANPYDFIEKVEYAEAVTSDVVVISKEAQLRKLMKELNSMNSPQENGTKAYGSLNVITKKQNNRLLKWS